LRQIFQFLLPITFFLISCSSRKGDFLVRSPSGWTTIDTISKYSGRHVTTYPPVTSTTPIFVENVNISISQSHFVDIYIVGVISFLKKQALYFKEKGRGTIIINQYSVEWEQHIIQTKDSEWFEQRGYYFSSSGNIYQMVYTTKANQMDKYQKEIEQMLESFKILQ